MLIYVQHIDRFLKLNLFACVGAYTFKPQCMWRLEDELWELVLSFHLIVSGDQIPVVRIGSKFLYPLRHLIDSPSPPPKKNPTLLNKPV